MTKLQQKRWNYALSLVDKVNKKLDSNSNYILSFDQEIISDTNRIMIKPNGIYSEIMLDCFVLGDNNPNYNNGVMYNTKQEIKQTFKRIRIYKEVPIRL
jgi:hypothetical protein